MAASVSEVAAPFEIFSLALSVLISNCPRGEGSSRFADIIVTFIGRSHRAWTRPPARNHRAASIRSVRHFASASPDARHKRPHATPGVAMRDGLLLTGGLAAMGVGRSLSVLPQHPLLCNSYNLRPAFGRNDAERVGKRSSPIGMLSQPRHLNMFEK